MNDLISRSELLKSINEEAKKIPIDAEKYHIDTNVIDGMNATLKAITNIVKEQPTAYDVDKVVKQLIDDLPNNEDYLRQTTINLAYAIKIVKQGDVSDDVCEWKLEDEEANLYVTKCQQRHLIFEGTPKDNGYKHCPYCGKKIKVVDNDK